LLAFCREGIILTTKQQQQQQQQKVVEEGRKQEKVMGGTRRIKSEGLVQPHLLQPNALILL
jgi:hypothetical protein